MVYVVTVRNTFIEMKQSTLSSYLKEQLITRMQEKNLSYSALEKKAGIGHGAIRNFLTGRTLNPTLETIEAVANVVGLTHEELLFGEKGLGSVSKASSQTKNIIEEKHYQWVGSLFIQSVEAVEEFLKKKELSLSLDQVLIIIREVYLYALEINNGEISIPFVEWIVESKLSDK